MLHRTAENHFLASRIDQLKSELGGRIESQEETSRAIREQLERIDRSVGRVEGMVEMIARDLKT
jgi:archaellum component FlaC